MAKIHFTRLGKIAQAEIELSPLTIFVGRNNTGKSYAATLIWALTNIGLYSGRFNCPMPVWWTSFKEEVSQAGAATLVIDAGKRVELIGAFNSLLRERAPELMSDVLVFDGFSELTVSAQAEQDEHDFSVTLAVIDPSDDTQSKKRPFIRGTVHSGSEFIFRMHYPLLITDALQRLSDRLFFEAMGNAVWGQEWRMLRSASYIPAARTGLLIAYRSLFASLIAGEDTPRPILPRPLSDFIQLISFPRGYGEENLLPVSNWVEQTILHGSVEEVEGDTPSFVFQSSQSGAKVPIHATSSMITEIAPFVLALRNSSKEGLIIFEEPEAHLHLSAQRDMARAIARLVNAGSRVLITTHSDTFLQQLNNLITLFNHPRRGELSTELGYSEDDLLDPTVTRTYEFKEERGQTEVRSIPCGATGYAVDSLNETIIALTRESLALTEVDDDE